MEKIAVQSNLSQTVSWDSPLSVGTVAWLITRVIPAWHQRVLCIQLIIPQSLLTSGISHLKMLKNGDFGGYIPYTSIKLLSASLLILCVFLFFVFREMTDHFIIVGIA